MKYWSTDGAALDLANNSLSEWQKAKYYIATLIIQLVSAVIIVLLVGTYVSFHLVWSYAACALITYLYVVVIHKSCEANDNVSVIEALVVIGLPASIKAAVVYWASSLIVRIVYSAELLPNGIVIFFHFALTPMFYVLYFSLISGSIDRANSIGPVSSEVG
jgi:hypothetical protein